MKESNNNPLLKKLPVQQVMIHTNTAGQNEVISSIYIEHIYYGDESTILYICVERDSVNLSTQILLVLSALQSLVGSLSGQFQLLLLSPHFLTLLAAEASLQVRAGLWCGLGCAHCGESHSSSNLHLISPRKALAPPASSRFRYRVCSSPVMWGGGVVDTSDPCLQKQGKGRQKQRNSLLSAFLPHPPSSLTYAFLRYRNSIQSILKHSECSCSWLCFHVELQPVC